MAQTLTVFMIPHPKDRIRGRIAKTKTGAPYIQYYTPAATTEAEKTHVL